MTPTELVALANALTAARPDLTQQARAKLAVEIAHTGGVSLDAEGEPVFSDAARAIEPRLPTSAKAARLAALDRDLAALNGKTDSRSVNQRITLREQRARLAMTMRGMGGDAQLHNPTQWDREHGGFPTALTPQAQRDIAGPLGKTLGFQDNAERSTVTPRRWEAHATLDTRSDGDRYKAAAEREARARAALAKRGIDV